METRKLTTSRMATIGSTEQPPSDMYGTVQSRGSIDLMPNKPMINASPMNFGDPSTKKIYGSDLDSFRYAKIGVDQTTMVGQPVSLENPIRNETIQAPVMPVIPVCPPCPKCGCKVVEGFYGGSCSSDNNVLLFIILLVAFFYLMKK